VLLAGVVREEETERRKREGRKGIKKEEKKVGEIFKLEIFLDKNKRSFMKLMKNYISKRKIYA
jgi:hypothetical protein